MSPKVMNACEHYSENCNCCFQGSSRTKQLFLQ